MEIQPLLADQRAKIDVYRSPKSVPTGKSLFLLALEVPERIADVLKIESHGTLQQVRPLAAPISEEMSMRALTYLVAVRTAERFLVQNLGIGGKCKYTQSAAQ